MLLGVDCFVFVGLFGFYRCCLDVGIVCFGSSDICVFVAADCCG